MVIHVFVDPLRLISSASARSSFVFSTSYVSQKKNFCFLFFRHLPPLIISFCLRKTSPPFAFFSVLEVLCRNECVFWSNNRPFCFHVKLSFGLSSDCRIFACELTQLSSLLVSLMPSPNVSIVLFSRVSLPFGSNAAALFFLKFFFSKVILISGIWVASLAVGKMGTWVPLLPALLSSFHSSESGFVLNFCFAHL